MAAHLSTCAEFLSIGRTSSSEHFGVAIWSASTLVPGQLADFRLMCHRLIVLSTTLELDMANPKELREAAEAIRDVRRLPAVQRHQQLEDLLRQAEEWARNSMRACIFASGASLSLSSVSRKAE